MDPVLMLARRNTDRQREHRSTAESPGENMLVVINGIQPVILGGALDVTNHHRVRNGKSAAFVGHATASG